MVSGFKVQGSDWVVARRTGRAVARRSLGRAVARRSLGRACSLAGRPDNWFCSPATNGYRTRCRRMVQFSSVQQVAE